jgi:hypothetical protein
LSAAEARVVHRSTHLKLLIELNFIL